MEGLAQPVGRLRPWPISGAPSKHFRTRSDRVVCQTLLGSLEPAIGSFEPEPTFDPVDPRYGGLSDSRMHPTNALRNHQRRFCACTRDTTPSQWCGLHRELAPWSEYDPIEPESQKPRNEGLDSEVELVCPLSREDVGDGSHSDPDLSRD